MTQTEVLDSMKTQAQSDQTLSDINTTSKTSVFYLILYVTSFALASFWELLTTHKTEVSDSVENKQRHDVAWYKGKALAFQLGYELVAETDYYDNSALSDEEIEASKIVKYAIAVQENDRSVVNIKIANENKEPLTAQELTAFTTYIFEVLDLGVNVNIINKSADSLQLELLIYYDAKIINPDGSLIGDSATFPVKDAVFSYIENIDFNAGFAAIFLVEALKEITGVKIPEVITAKYKYDALSFQNIVAIQIPNSGSFELSEDNLTINYVAL